MSKRLKTVLVLVTWLAMAQAHAQWDSYERMTVESLRAAIAQSSSGTRPQLTGKNLSGLDLAEVDFRGANLSASVLNGAKLTRARLDRTNLTVSFLEGADLTGASLRDAMMFSVQLEIGRAHV